MIYPRSFLRYLPAFLLLVSLACSAVVTVTPDPAPSKPMVRTATPSVPPTSAVLPAAVRLAVPTAELMTVCADALNVRSGPGLDTLAVAWLRRGDIVRVLGWRDGWASLANGWVKGVYLGDDCLDGRYGK